MVLQSPLKRVSKSSKRINAFKYGQWSGKALDFLQNCNAPINISHGAVRSGKTVTSTLAWLGFIANSPHKEFMQSGRTRGSLYRNVLRDEMAILEERGIEYNHLKADGILEVEDNVIWLIGFRDERVSDVLRGMTIGGWYGDETNTYPKLAVEDALDRCSLSGSQVFWTMNPDSPYHYIYTDYITNQGLLDAGDVRVWHYTLDDNPNIPSSYVDQIKRRYPQGSVQYKRKVLGLWVVAEGLIYDRFIESQHVLDDMDGTYDYYVISTDYGPGNVSVAGLFGIRRSREGNLYHLLDEFYYDVNQHGVQLTDEEFADHSMSLLHQNNVDLPLSMFFTPHDASSLRATLSKRYYQGKPLPVRSYMPDTFQDIIEIQKCIVENRFHIHQQCKDSISQIQTYAWDPKAQQRGEDKPLKVNDHCPDMWRGAILGTRNLGGGGLYAVSKQKFDYAQ